MIHLQVLEPAGRDHDLALQRADELVVFADGGVQRAADGGGVAAHHRQAFVELLAQFRDFLGIPGLFVGAPAIGHRLAQGEQGRRRHDHHA